MSAKAPYRFDLSPHRIALYERCGFAFKLRYKDKVRSANPGRATRAGGAVHHGLARALLPASSTHGAARCAAVALGRSSGQLDVTRFLGPKAGDRAKEIAKALNVSLPRVKDRRCEDWWELPLGDVKLAGRFDLVDVGFDNAVTVIDWKTGRVDERPMLADIQVLAYLAAARYLYPRAPRITATWRYLPAGPDLSVDAPADVIAVLRARVAPIWRAIRSGVFPVTASYDACRGCPVRFACSHRVRRPPAEPLPEPSGINLQEN